MINSDNGEALQFDEMWQNTRIQRSDLHSSGILLSVEW